MSNLNPKVYFRVDHGKLIGDGHLYRCKALARCFDEMGFDVTFVTRPQQGFNLEKFDSFKVVKLKGKESTDVSSKDYQTWLKFTPEEDVRECIDLVVPQSGSIWIVDHYGLNDQWEILLRVQHQLVVVIDDIFREHAADIIIDHNFTASLDRYKPLNRIENALYLMGPSFALMRKDICSSSEYQYIRSKSSHLVYLGGSPEDLFYKLLTALRGLKVANLEILNPPIGFEPKTGEKVFSICHDLVELYARQKIVFGSCGVAAIERVMLGIPSISHVVVENQVEAGNKLDELEATYHVGDLRKLSQSEVESKLKYFLELPIEFLWNRAQKSKKLVAKDGVEKIVAEITKRQHQKF